MKSKKLRASARGRNCTLNIVGVCNSNPETVVLCHLPDETGTGIMAGKSDDWIAVFGCSSCHDILDGRVYSNISKKDLDFYSHRALLRTWRIMIEEGLITIA